MLLSWYVFREADKNVSQKLLLREIVSIFSTAKWLSEICSNDKDYADLSADNIRCMHKEYGITAS